VGRRRKRQGENIFDLDNLRQHIQTLDNGDDVSRRQAIQALKDHEEEEWAAAPLGVIHSLVEALQRQLLSGTKHPFVRQDVVAVLGNLGHRSGPAVPQLVELLRDGIPDGVRCAAALALGKIGKEARVAVDPLIKLVSHGRTPLAVQAIRALSGIGCADKRVRTALVDLWLSPTQPKDRQGQVAVALCKLKIDAGGVLTFLTSALGGSQDTALRKAAAEALAWSGKDEPDVVPALVTAALKDKDEEVRQTAEAAVAQLRLSPDQAVRLCSKQLKDSSLAEAALRNSGQVAVPALVEALGMEEPSVREKAARILGCSGELAAEAVPALTAALQDADPAVRLAVAKSLWNITNKADVAVPALVDLLEENGPAPPEASEIRRRFLQTVMEALGRIGPPATAAVSALKAKAKDKNRHISECALRALGTIAPTVAKKQSCSQY